jgi:hypothetical protein
LDEENSKHAGSNQQNGFGPAFLHSLLRLGKGIAKLNTYQRREEESKKYDLTAVPCF